MPGDEIQPTNDPIELSDEDLDEVAGGLNLLINAGFFRKIGIRSEDDSASIESIESAGLQILITDASAEDLEFLGNLLGKADAVKGLD
ncbi:hypothetical protein K9N68_04010 [Kovacikia minuta CCNUW1]|uniref:hypothetical protein n=1 Tax=Kovacikia minuta TaxID=2931930 RepID=UPI001CCDAA3B|nr:hypothetical protein [Kovacikia minuta]UBF27139.1 hypothetical protein K9N68_04010 [Kovacikia minuta CCNUW1]